MFFQLTEYEHSTPLAFSIVVHNHIGQLEALMGSLFRPQNSYCIYVDPKTSSKFKSGVEKMMLNYKIMFPTVILLKIIIERDRGREKIKKDARVNS